MGSVFPTSRGRCVSRWWARSLPATRSSVWQDEIDLGEVIGSSTERSDSTFALKVDGESMKDEGILNGDFVLVERTEVARDGDKVVALLPDGSTTLKTFFKEDDHIRLQPANPDFDPIRVKFCTIQGIVRGVVRQY